VLGSIQCGVKDDVDMSLITKLKKIRSRSKHNEVRDDDYERRKIMSQEKHLMGHYSIAHSAAKLMCRDPLEPLSAHNRAMGKLDEAGTNTTTE
jgi:hypothetical protein